MSFKDWLFSSYDNPSINGQWGIGEIITVILCIAIIVTATLLLRKRSDKSKYIYILIVVMLLLSFEIARRVINLCKTTDFSFNHILYILLPRPWCAISSFCIIASVFVKKKSFYAFACIEGLICALIFFAWPSVGFNNKYILFENLYSIATHSLILVSSISFITLGFAKFDYKKFWKSMIMLVCVIAYAFIEIYLLKIEHDPLYFMPDNDIMQIVGLNSYAVFLIIYIAFIAFYFNLFYFIPYISTKIRSRKNI